jgi:formate-dependent nitrite reductase cytochrome c552 subunit
MKRLLRRTALLLILVLILAACGQSPATQAPETTEAQAETENDNAVISTADMPKGIVEAAAWKEAYPAVVSTFERNAEEVKTTYGGSEPYDYLEAYPYLRTFYKGYVFEVQYNRARGHVNALEDVVETGRPKKGASCLACKVSEFNEMVNEDPSLHAANFVEFVDEHITVGFTCFDCHGETPGVVHTNRLHLNQALERNAEIELTTQQTSCAPNKPKITPKARFRFTPVPDCMVGTMASTIMAFIPKRISISDKRAAMEISSAAAPTIKRISVRLIISLGKPIFL